MTERLDARGLSCPQPVVITRQKLETLGTGSLEVLVDTETACENITRLAKSSGWSADAQPHSGDIIITLKKQ